MLELVALHCSAHHCVSEAAGTRELKHNRLIMRKGMVVKLSSYIEHYGSKEMPILLDQQYEIIYQSQCYTLTHSLHCLLISGQAQCYTLTHSLRLLIL